MQQHKNTICFLLRIICLLTGVFACSTAVIMIKLSKENPFLVASYRQLLASFILMPLFLYRLKLYGFKKCITAFKGSILPGILLGAHFITWIIGARLTPAANSSLIVNLVPVVMPFILLFMVQEKVNVGEIAGTLFGLIGVILLSIEDFRVDRSSFLGDLICFGSMIIFAFYLVIAKARKESLPSLWLYVVPVYASGGIFCLVSAMPFTTVFKKYHFDELLLFLGLAVIPTVIGHSILNYSMRMMRGQIVAIVNLGQCIFSTIMGYFILNEIPRTMVLPAAILIFIGAVLAIKFGL